MSTIESITAIVIPTPTRTCVGCRKTAAKTELQRVVCVDGVITVDVRTRLAGRGAYLHRDLQCLQQAESRRAFQRALRLSQAPLVTEEFRMSIATTDHAGA